MRKLSLTLLSTSTLILLSGCVEQHPKEGTSSVKPAIQLEETGVVRPKTTHEIETSNWSVGGETMDRDYTIYNNWKSYIEPLGIKRIRIQSGWAKTEKIKGSYDWDWLDEIIPDMIQKSVSPWVCLCFGNPLYEGGGIGFPHSPLPVKGEAAAGWVRFVKAMAERYKEQVTEWEIWNEPNHHSHNIQLEDYIELIRITAIAVRDVQPNAKIFVMSLAGVDVEYTQKALTQLKENGLLHLVDQVTYHPYSYNPDNSYKKVDELREVVKIFDPRLTIFQGENGAPSERNEKRALRNHDWTEISQAKWALRRMLADLGHDIPSSYFSLMDMKYPEEINRKGLLYASEDKRVLHPKLSYYAISNMTAIFDDNLERIKEFEYTTSSDRLLSAYAYQNKKSRLSVITLWYSDKAPDNELNTQTINIEAPGIHFKKPVLVDLLSGRIYKIPLKSNQDGILKDIPVYDSPIVIIEEKMVK